MNNLFHIQRHWSCYSYSTLGTQKLHTSFPSPNFDVAGELYMKQLHTGFCLTYLIASLDETYPTVDYI